MNRREHITLLLAALGATMGATPIAAWESLDMEEVIPTFGLIGQIVATSGQRSVLGAILQEATGDMPGNMGYLIGEDAANPDALWVVELWTDEAAHAASLHLPQVQQAIARARPMIASFGQRVQFRPLARSPENR
jgi:quinol monooxygenase YgiN